MEREEEEEEKQEEGEDENHENDCDEEELAVTDVDEYEGVTPVATIPGTVLSHMTKIKHTCTQYPHVCSSVCSQCL